jgi:hypothetical protein
MTFHVKVDYKRTVPANDALNTVSQKLQTWRWCENLRFYRGKLIMYTERVFKKYVIVKKKMAVLC